METKFTKSQWIRDGRFIYAIGKKGKHDANLFSCSVSNDNLLLSTEEIEANAKLIAAAPELLEALIELFDSLPDGYEAECLPNVRKAIEKATK